MNYRLYTEVYTQMSEREQPERHVPSAYRQPAHHHFVDGYRALEDTRD